MAVAGRLRRSVRLLLRLALVCILLSALLVLWLRFVPPPASAVMIERRLEAWGGPDAYVSRQKWVGLDRIAPVMGVAVIAAEDQRFTEHFGFDWQAIEKAVAYNERSARTRGASTLSQQTAKNLFLWSDRDWIRKGLEAYFTFLLEAEWPKRRIIEMYLNIVEFGDGVFGVEAAAQHYFKQPAARLSAGQAALLAAVLPNPHRFKVDAPTAYVLERQQWILGQMRQLGGNAMLKEMMKE